VTLGEPAGIGAEVIGKAWASRDTARLPPFYALADPEFLDHRLRAAGLAVPLRPIDAISETEAIFDTALPVCPLRAPVRSGTAGTPSTDDAAAVLESIERAVGDVIAGDSRAVVTAPVQKETLYGAGFAFPGHTEFLGELAARHGLSARPVMMLASEDLRAVPVTIHVPLAAVPGLITTPLIVETGRIVAEGLRKHFRISQPRLAVAGLNPHAGEGAQIGLEDRDVIAPAIDRLRELGIDASGPYPADTMFHPAARAGYDAAIAMYHDQALIPIKTIAFDTAVNVTLGLPFVRTSPDHGTALSIAATGQANPSSLIEAIRMADRMSGGT